VLTADPTTGQHLVVSQPVAGGSPTVLLRANRGMTLRLNSFAPDRRSLFVQERTATGTSSIWWIPVDGRAPRVLPELSGFDSVIFEFHPDGKRLALELRHPRSKNDEVFVLQNFLASLNRRRGR
jgi:hypothetical protein